VWETYGKTYSQIEHSRLLRGAEIGALGDFGVGVELSHGIVSSALPLSSNNPLRRFRGT
jgi:hypothetical protein